MKFICNGCKKPCILDTGDYPLTINNLRCVVGNNDLCKWEKYEDGEVAKLPKLTAEVFDRPDCPVWAKYAAVSKFGCLTFFERKPVLGNNCFLPLVENHTTKPYRNEPGSWDASDWQNSLIERPAKLPDWCNVGEWVYYDCPETDSRYYVEITEIGAERDYIKGQSFGGGEFYADYCFEFFKQARLTQWTFEDAPEILKVKDAAGKYRLAKLKYNDIAEQWGYFIEGNVEQYNFSIPFDGIAKEFTQLDGSPCGVLEHLNREGEWVK